jgi:hypothetical protein
VLILLALAATVGYLVLSTAVSPRSAATGAGRHLVPPPFVIFRTLAPSAAHGRVAILALAPRADRRVTDLSCLRLHYAGGRGLCATYDGDGSSARYVAHVFDHRFIRGARIELDGVPTRIRIAPTASVGAITTYAEEETAAGERLASHTRIIDLQTGQSVADLRAFAIDHHSFRPLDGPHDIASIAFEDGDRFFATVSTASARYLAAGSLSERRLRTLRAGFANEALSPDGRRLAAKRLDEARGFWRLSVIDLATWAERELPQGTHSVDDQVEWLDDNHLVYHDADGDRTSLWVVAADGSTAPRVLIKDAYSAAIQR